MSYIKYIVKFVFFWLLYFLANRILFILFFIPEVSSSDFTEIIRIFPNSIGLDISFICYMLSIIGILFWMSSFLSNQKSINKLIYYFNAIILVLSGFINGGEVALYSEWNTKLNFTALSHFSNPDAMSN